jgi:hypothetical protein
MLYELWRAVEGSIPAKLRDNLQMFQILNSGGEDAGWYEIHRGTYGRKIAEAGSMTHALSADLFSALRLHRRKQQRRCIGDS